MVLLFSNDAYSLIMLIIVNHVHMKVQLEMLQMDLEDNETAMNSFDSRVEELKETIESLEALLAQNQTQMSDMEVQLEDSKAQVDPISSTTSV